MRSLPRWIQSSGNAERRGEAPPAYADLETAPAAGHERSQRKQFREIGDVMTLKPLVIARGVGIKNFAC